MEAARKEICEAKLRMGESIGRFILVDFNLEGRAPHVGLETGDERRVVRWNGERWDVTRYVKPVLGNHTMPGWMRDHESNVCADTFAAALADVRAA